MYVIKSGEVKLFANYYIETTKQTVGPQMMKPLKKSQRVELAILNEAEFVGDLEIYDYEKRICTAVCTTDCVLFQIPFDNFKRYCREIPGLDDLMKKRVKDRLDFRLSHLEDFKATIKAYEVKDSNANPVNNIIKQKAKEAKEAKEAYMEMLNNEQISQEIMAEWGNAGINNDNSNGYPQDQITMGFDNIENKSDMLDGRNNTDYDIDKPNQPRNASTGRNIRISQGTPLILDQGAEWKYNKESESSSPSIFFVS